MSVWQWFWTLVGFLIYILILIFLERLLILDIAPALT